MSEIGASAYIYLAACGTLLACGLSLVQPKWLPLRLPPLRLWLRLLVLAAVDVSFAALAFWVLLPEVFQPEFSLLLAAFILALGAGLLSGSPGGVGPFELCLVTLLPGVAEVELIAAGRPSSNQSAADVIIVLGAPSELSQDYAHGIVQLLRRRMKNRRLVVEIHCLKQLWQETIY